MAHPAPYRQYPGPSNGHRPPPDQYGPPRGGPTRQGSIPRDQGLYDDGFRSDHGGYGDRNQLYRGPPPQQQGPYPPRGGRPPQMRPPPPGQGYPRDQFYDRRGPPPGAFDGPRPSHGPPPPRQQGPPRGRQRPPMHLDLAVTPNDLPRPRLAGADEYLALVSPIYDKRFDDGPRSPPFQSQSMKHRMPPALRRNEPPPGDVMPTMQFNFDVPPPRTKSAPPDDPRNWDQNIPPPPRLNGEYYDDRRGPPPPTMNGRGGPPPPRGGGRPHPGDRPPPQQLYDRGPEPRRRSPPQQYDQRGPPSRSNSFPVPNDGYDPRGPPSPLVYNQGPPSDQRLSFEQHPRRDPREGYVDEMLDTYLEELGSPAQQYGLPPQQDPRMDPRGPDPRFDPRHPPPSRAGLSPDRRSPPFLDGGPPPDQYIPPDRRQLAAQAGGISDLPARGMLPRSQTAPAITLVDRGVQLVDRGVQLVDRGVQQMDLRQTSPEPPRGPNKLQKSPPKQTSAIGVQPQRISGPNGATVDPNALPAFPEPENSRNSTTSLENSRGSRSSEGSYGPPIPPPNPERPPLTFQMLEEYRKDAKEHPNDTAVQLDYAKALSEASVVLAPEQGMGDPKRVAKARENYLSDAHKLVKKLASSGSTEAMFFLASCYGEGQMGFTVDLEKAFNLYFQAAKLGHTASAYRTAMCCEVGIGTKRDPAKALQFYRKAANKGDVASMFKLGVILLRGLLNIPSNPREGVNWLQRAAENATQDVPQALFILGQLYENPDESVSGTILKDEAYALELYTKGAQLGYAPAQHKLGTCFEYGSLGCEVNSRRSIAWFSRAAEQGDPEAELALSGWYLTGADGILQQSDTEAFLWGQKAAEKGNAKAEFALGYYFETGIGTPPNLVEAKRWYLRAAEQGQKRAMARLAELKRSPNGGPGIGSSGGRKELQKQRRGGGAGKEDCVVM